MDGPTSKCSRREKRSTASSGSTWSPGRSDRVIPAPEDATWARLVLGEMGVAPTRLASEFSPGFQVRRPLRSHQSVVFDVVDQVNDDDIAISNGVKHSVKGGKIRAVEIPNPERLNVNFRDRTRRNDFAPLAISLDPSDGRSNALRYRFSGLLVLRGKFVDFVKLLLYPRMNCDRRRPEGHESASEPPSFCYGIEKLRAQVVSPLDAFRTFNRKPQLEVMPEGSIQPGSGCRVS